MIEKNSNIDKVRNSEKQPGIAILCIVLAMWLIVYMMQWEIVGFVTLFLIQPLQWLVLIICALAALVWIIRTAIFLVHNGFRKRFILKIFVGLFLIGAITTSLFFPIDDYYEEARFAVFSKQFDKAAAIALEERPLSGYFQLPIGYRFLSRDDRGVEVFGAGESKAVFFYTFVGILDNYSGYAFVPNPQAYQELLKNGDWVQIIPERDNWYFCASM